tara:strand:- start:717 stop:1265 length:549 start_codon:yes stop_codon:yes gene_type:complete
MLKNLRFEPISVEEFFVSHVQLKTRAPLAMNMNATSRVFLRVRAGRQKYPQDSHHDNVRDWMVFVHVSLVKPLNSGVTFQIIPGDFLKKSVINVLPHVLEVLVELFMLRVLFLLSEHVPKIDVQDHNDFTNWHESGVQRLLDGMQASLLNVLVQICELVDNVLIIVVVNQKVYQDVARHPQL